MRMVLATGLLALGAGAANAQQAPETPPSSSVIVLQQSDFTLSTLQDEVTTCPMPTVGIDSAAVAEMERKRTAQEQAPGPATPTARSRCANPLAVGQEADLRVYLVPKQGKMRAWEKSQPAP